MTLEELVGQKLVFGIEGTRLTQEIIDLFRKTHAGGLILFRRNFDSADALRGLLADLDRALARKILVMVDHEGGRVIHFGEGVTIFPDAQAVGVAGQVEWAERQGQIEAQELRSLGIDLNLAPVLDVVAGERCPAIGTRSYGENPELVSQMGSARIKGMQSQGLWACAKHYPGLGAAELDPHGELPVIRKSWKALKEFDLVPFRKAFEAGVDTVMSSHPVYPEIDSRAWPATFSRRLMHDYLRLELGFSGVSLTDDLKMGAISKMTTLAEAVPLAAKAGHDLLLICSDPVSQLKAFESLAGAYKKKDLSESELEASLERLEKLRAKRPERFLKKSVNPEEGKKLARLIAQNAACVLRKIKMKTSPLTVLFPDLAPVAKERFVEKEILEPEEFLRQVFRKLGVPFKKIHKILMNPDERMRASIIESVQNEENVLFFCWDGHQFEGTKELLVRLQEKAPSLSVLLLREPRDVRWIGPRTGCATAYGFRVSQVEAALEKMFSET